MLRHGSRWLVWALFWSARCLGKESNGQASSSSSPKASPSATYTADLAAIPRGARRGAVYLDDIDVTLTLRLAPLVGWQGATLFVYGLGTQGGRPSRYAGDAQGVDNIEAPNGWKLYEAWLEQVTAGGRLSLLAGLYDLNSEFDHLRSADLFVNSSQGVDAALGLSGRNGPSIFPTTSLGVRAKALVARRAYLQVAVLDGVPGSPTDPRGTHVSLSANDGAFLGFETGVLLGLRAGRRSPERARRARRRRVSHAGADSYRYKLELGTWLYSGPLDDARAPAPAVGPRGHVDHGGYVGFDGVVYRPDDDARRGLALHARIAYADALHNRFSTYFGGGAVYTGLVPGRPADELGAAWSVAGHVGRRPATRGPRDPTTRGSEIALESTYLAQLASWFSAQLDLQMVLQPNSDPAHETALVVITRVQAAF